MSAAASHLGAGTDAALALVGQHGSGKTTFLGALLDGLDSGRVRALRKGPRPSDARALRALTDALLRGEYPKRTAKGTQQELLLPLRKSAAGGAEHAFTLRLSDYDGQEIEDLFTLRTSGWSAAWRARAQVRHLLLFLRAPTHPPISTSPGDAEPWSRLRAVEAAPGRPQETLPFAPLHPADHFAAASHSALPAPAALPAAAPLSVPQALPLIEILQFLRAAQGLDPGERPPLGALRVAVCLTAWDQAHPAWRARGPAALLGAHAALLTSFLWANFHEEDIACFGLSATGGDLNDPAYCARYKREEDGASGFVEWRHRDEPRRANDLGVPLCFALSGEAALELGAAIHAPHG